MSFHPRMQSRIEGIAAARELRWRAWGAAIADVWSVACDPAAGGEYVSHAPRLVVMLGHTPLTERSGGVRFGLAPGCMGCPLASLRGAMSYIPAGVRTWARVENARALKHLDIHLDTAALAGRAAMRLDPQALATPRLGFADDRLAGLARLIAAECEAPDPAGDLYGDALIDALVAALLRPAPETCYRKGGLSPCLVRRATDFIADNCARNIRLSELAELTGLSESYFCSAFKAATGLPPHRWQMRARLERAKALLAESGLGIAEAAAAAGFADQSHLTRAFRRQFGVTPAAWLRDRRG